MSKNAKNFKHLKAKSYKLKADSGFTLLEVIVAVGVLLVAVSTSAGLVLDSLQSVDRAQNRVTAAYLAQEGIEIARNIRDTNWIEDSGSWTEGLNPGASDQCVDFDGSALLNPCPEPNNALYWDSNPGVYTHDSGGSNELTIFERRITVSQIINPEDASSVDPDVLVLQVLSTVSWGGPNPGSITVEDRLYNWR